MRVPATTDVLQESRGNLEKPEIRVWCHPHKIGKPGKANYVVFDTFKAAMMFVEDRPDAEDVPLIAFGGYELNLWEMEPDSPASVPRPWEDVQRCRKEYEKESSDTAFCAKFQRIVREVYGEDFEFAECIIEPAKRDGDCAVVTFQRYPEDAEG